MTPTKKNPALEVQEQMISTDKKSKNLKVGILKESTKDEMRVPLTPVGAGAIVNAGYKVIMEQGAGLGANYSDADYVKQGITIASTKRDVINTADILVKIAPFTDDEILMLPEGKTVFSAVHLNAQRKENIVKLQNKKVTAIAYEFIKEQDGFSPFMMMMNQITGSVSVMIAAELLSNASGGKGIMLGGVTGITPSEILVLGTDTAAEYAVRIALGLGSSVKIFDDDLSGLIRMERLFGQHIFTSTFSDKALNKAVSSANVIINSLERKPGEGFKITSGHLGLMKKGSVIVDLKTDAGSIIETSRPTTFDNPTYKIGEVVHYCVPNIPSRVARTASIAISNVLSPIIVDICKAGDILPVLKRSVSLRNGTYLFLGMVTHPQVAERFDLDLRDLNLLVALF